MGLPVGLCQLLQKFMGVAKIEFKTGETHIWEEY